MFSSPNTHLKCQQDTLLPALVQKVISKGVNKRHCHFCKEEANHNLSQSYLSCLWCQCYLSCLVTQSLTSTHIFG